MTAGKPLRFMAAMVGGWIALRAFALWPSSETIRRAADLSGPAIVEAAVRSVPARAAIPLLVVPPPRYDATTTVARAIPPAAIPVSATLVSATPISTLVAAVAPFRGPTPPQVPTIPPPLVPTPIASGSGEASRWRASAWLIARGGQRQAPLGGQLGASQAGARVTYAILPSARIALSARVATPLAGKGREAAVGLDWQPTHAPVHVIVEQRIAINGGRGGPTVELVGGFGPSAILPGIDAEGYAQAGGIVRESLEAFVDGATRVTHRVAQRDRLRVDLGVGAWGGAQRGASRLDVGPTVGVVVPVGETAVRVTLDCGIM
ncbi:hypothetical protein [Sphingomonas oligophenolica]|uniref:Uncharacterized protein n=1 Tax=Sphingomonas oligophenolica TaxID=301154 RepID=A0A502CSZ2_9SPHN|nr:hypothetical protein [Sphingomonas oligophenolica]TPG15630.1 hypothetical protein EAH84_02245 [Sphingomonas oligophenolica]